jgi:MFS family permease
MAHDRLQDAVPQSAAGETQVYPPRAYAWFVVAILSAGYAAALLDRWVLSLLVQPVKAHFHLSDTQVGLLMGPAFAMCYIVMGLPFGWMADRFNRRNIIAGAMGFWCLMTACCGLARTGTQLTFARFGIGVGEAGLSPAANSIIADSFPRALQSRAIGVFNLGIYAGMGLSYLIGGAIVALTAGKTLTLPFVGLLESWQIVFLLVGLPGLVIAIIVMFLIEPRRREKVAPGADSASFARCFAYVGRHWKALVPLAVGMGAAPLVGYTNNWLPTMFTRTWGWPVSRFSLVYGLILLIMGPLGAVSSGFLAARFNTVERRDGSYKTCLIGLAIVVTCGALMPFSPSPYVALALLAPGAFCGSLATAAGVAAVVFATPGLFRGRILAMYTITNGTIGVFAGPAAAGVLTDHLFTGHDGIRYAMSTVVLVGGGLLTLLMLTGRKAYGGMVKALEAAA